MNNSIKLQTISLFVSIIFTVIAFFIAYQLNEVNETNKELLSIFSPDSERNQEINAKNKAIINRQEAQFNASLEQRNDEPAVDVFDIWGIDKPANWQ